LGFEDSSSCRAFRHFAYRNRTSQPSAMQNILRMLLTGTGTAGLSENHPASKLQNPALTALLF
jgi:hypothetical protein